MGMGRRQKLYQQRKRSESAGKKVVGAAGEGNFFSNVFHVGCCCYCSAHRRCRCRRLWRRAQQHRIMAGPAAARRSEEGQEEGQVPGEHAGDANRETT